MGGKSSSTTVGYKFYCGASIVFAKLVHRILQIRIGDNIAWNGVLSNEGVININKPQLFGTSAEGGVVGNFAFQPGLPDQMPDSYLISKLGSDISANRGVSQLVLRQPYMGNNPYLKDIQIRAERIHLQDDGSAQWYDAKAQIGQVFTGILSLYFALDVSSSMATVTSNGKTRLFNLQTAINSVLDYISTTVNPQLAQNADICIVAFGAVATPMTKYQATADDITALKTFINGLGYDYVATDFNVAMSQAATFYNGVNSNATKRMFLITDGEPDSGVPADPTANAQAARAEVDAIPDGICYAANIDESNTTYTSIVDNSGNTVPVINGGDPTALIAYIQANMLAVADMNPAHMLRECLLNPEWGYGYDEDDLDIATFQSVADKLYSETFGLSYFWDDDNTQLDDVINKILDHIDGVLYIDRSTLKWTLTLNRNDYNVDDLIELRAGVEVISISDYSKPQFLDLANTIVVNYYNTQNGGDGSITASNSALYLQQGVRISKTADYEMCCRSDLAAVLLQRELDINSNPLSLCTVQATSAAKSLRRGSVFKLTSSRHNYNQTVMRITDISYGDGKTKAIKISCIEDRFAMPQKANVNPEKPIPPDKPNPQALTSRFVIETPYAMLIKLYGQSALDQVLATSPDAGYFGACAARNNAALYADIQVDAGAGYESVNRLDFGPYGELSADISYLTDTFVLQNTEDMDEMDSTVLMKIDDEFLLFTSYNSATQTFTGVKRGIFDSVPTPHSAGAKVFFFEHYLDGSDTQYVSGESINVKLLSTTPNGTLPLADAPADALAFVGRAIKPYPPGRLRLNSTAYPASITGALTVTWADRNRVSQADVPVDTTAASVTPEINTRYTLQFKDSTGALIISKSDIYPATAAVVLNYTGNVTLELWAVSDNGPSIQKHSYTFAYTPPGGTTISSIIATTYTPVYNGTIIDGGSA